MIRENTPFSRMRTPHDRRARRSFAWKLPLPSPRAIPVSGVCAWCEGTIRTYPGSGRDGYWDLVERPEDGDFSVPNVEDKAIFSFDDA